MERINPYAVMRNTATLEAYRARQRGVMWAGQPFTSFAIVCLTFVFFIAPNLGDFPRLFGLGPRMTLWIVLGSAIIPLAGGAFVLLAALRTRRYLREHPIPDEWRQVPRVSWPPGPARKPPLP
jgi:hypothetical protein